MLQCILMEEIKALIKSSHDERVNQTKAKISMFEIEIQ